MKTSTVIVGAAIVGGAWWAWRKWGAGQPMPTRPQATPGASAITASAGGAQVSAAATPEEAPPPIPAGTVLASGSVVPVHAVSTLTLAPRPQSAGMISPMGGRVVPIHAPIAPPAVQTISAPLSKQAQAGFSGFAFTPRQSRSFV